MRHPIGILLKMLLPITGDSIIDIVLAFHLRSSSIRWHSHITFKFEFRHPALFFAGAVHQPMVEIDMQLNSLPRSDGCKDGVFTTRFWY